MKRYRLKAILKTILFCLILLIQPISSVYQSGVEVVPQQTSSLVPEDLESGLAAQSEVAQSSSPEDATLYPEDFDLMKYLNDNPNDYQKVWEPWLTKAAVHAIATSEDGDFLAVGGGYLYDNEIHIYRWNLETREYDKVWDSGDGIIKGDVLSLAFGDTDNNKFMDIVAGSADGRIYVFEQRHIYDPYTRTENQFEHVWTSPKMRPVFSVQVEDTDKDGVLDILAGSWDGKIHAYEYRRRSGYPFSTEHWIDYEEVWNSGDVIPDKVTAITTADTNYNGLPEIIAGTRNGTIYIFENDGAVLYVEGVPFPLTNDNSYVLNSKISGYIWKPIMSLDSGDLDEDSEDEIVAVAAGQGAYVTDYTASGYQLNKLTRPLESWEVTDSPHSLDYYVDDMVSAKNVFYWWLPEPMDQPPPEISPRNTAMADESDGRYSIFRPYLSFVADYKDGPWWNTTPEFPDPTAKWIWNHPWKELYGEKGARVEEFWVTREFDLASSVELRISVTVDDYYTLYIDEMLVGNATKWESPETYKVELSAGRHYLRMKVGNAGTVDNPAGLIVSVMDSESGDIIFNSQGDGTWRTRATAVLDFGKDEEATGNGNDLHDLIVRFVTPSDFAGEPNFEELSFSVSQDLTAFAAIEIQNLQYEEWLVEDGVVGFYVYINLDRALAEKRWEYVQYLNITVDGDMKYTVDSIEVETLYRPLCTATAATIRTLNLDSQHSVWEFADRLEAYSTGVDYEEVVENYGRKEEPNKVVVGTADGRLLAFGYNSSSRLYDLVWDSYADDWFNMKTNIWVIQEVKTLGKIPTWMLNETVLDVPLSFKIDYAFEDYASMTFADVNLDRSLDMIIGTKQGNLTSLTSPTLETAFFSDVNTEYTEDEWVSAAFGQLNYTGLLYMITLTPESSDTTEELLTSESYPNTNFYYYRLFLDKLELVVGYYSPATGYSGLDYWDYPYEEKISLADMESTGYLRQALRMSSTLPKAALADMDGDGDFDITVTNGRIYYLENIGNTTDPSFEMKPDYYSSINLMSPDKVFSGPQLVDFDLDGDYDLIVGFANKHGATYYENTGTAQNPVWVEARRLFYNFKYSFRNDNFTDPAFYDVRGLYDILNTSGEALPAREVFLRAYVDTFGTSYVMSAYNNATNEIVAFVGDTGSHSRFVVGTNPRVARLEVALANGPLRNYGYHVLETWNNDVDLDEWTITVASGDVDGDRRNEVIVGDFDNNMYVFEHLTNNTYKRAFRSFDIHHTVVSEESPYAWEQLEGLSGKFYRTIWDHVEQLIANTDLDNDNNKEIIATADLSIYVFEWTGNDDEYGLIWREDLRKSAWGQDLKADGVEKITALSYHEDLDHNGYGEIIAGAGGFLFIYESLPDGTFREGHQTTTGVVGYWNFDEAFGLQASDSSGYDNVGTLLTGPTWVDGKHEKALSFDGVDDYVEVYPFSYDFTEITAAFWMRTDDTSKKGTPISSSSGTQHNEFLVYNYQNFSIYIKGGSVDTNISANDGLWHHIAVTWRGSDGLTKLFIDGVEKFAGTLKAGETINLANLIVGQEQDAFRGRFDVSQAFLGTIDEVAIYSRALSEEEIMTNMGGVTISDDLVGYWNLDEGSGDTAYDSSGYDNVGALSTGPTWVDGKYGKALSFDGINDYVEVPDSDSLDITNEITIEAWINFNPMKVGQRYTIVGKHYTAYELTLSQYDPQTGDGRTLQFYKGDPNYDPNDPGPSGGRSYDGFHLEHLDDILLPNMWNHIAVTWRGATVRFYINGNRYSPTSIDWFPVAETTNTNTDPLRIGTRYALTLSFNGTIDEVKIYNRALSVGEMEAIMGRLSFLDHTIQTIATGDTDSDGYNEIIIGGFSDSLNGFVYELEHRDGIYHQTVWSSLIELMEGSHVNTMVIDDQDYDGRKELIVGHEYGINIWEYTGRGWHTMEIMTSSPTYPELDLHSSLSYNDTVIPSFKRNSDIFQLSNGTLIQVYSKETGETIDMGPYAEPVPEVRLFFRTSDNEGLSWTKEEKRLTNDTEYESIPDYDSEYTVISEMEPSITESQEGTIWFTWTTRARKLVLKGGSLYPFIKQTILVKHFETSGWSPLEEIVSPTGLIFYSSPSIWYYGLLEFEIRDPITGEPETLYIDSMAVSYLNSTDGRVHYKRQKIVPVFWTLDWKYGGVLPHIGSDPSYPFEATSVDMISLHDGGRALAFAGRYKNEGKVDYDIWVMTANSTMGWKFPNRVTVKSSQEKHPSITQLNSQDETIVVVFESYGGPPEEAIQISYSKDLGRSWSEPEPLSAMGEEPVSPSVAARMDEGFFYSFTTAQWMKTKQYRFWRRIYEWTLKYGIFVGVNPSSDWTKYEIGNVHTLAVGDTDRDGLREIAANHKNKVTLFEIKHTGASYQEHMQVWTSQELPEAVTHITIGDGNGNDWPEIIIAAERGNVYSYEITNTDLPKGSLIASSVVAEITISSQFIEEVDIATGNFDQDSEPELVATVYENVTAYEANGVLLWKSSAQSTIRDMAVGDLNNDGVDDVAVGDWDGIVYAINGSAGTQLWNFTIPHEGFVLFIDRLAIGDLTGDGSNDVVVGTGTWGVDEFKIYAFDGITGAQLWPSPTSVSATITGLNVGNLTGDSIADVVATTIDGNVYAINGTDGSQLWPWLFSDPLMSLIYTPAVCDLDQDGIDDVVVAGSSLFALNGYTGLQIWNNTQVAGTAYTTLTADFNGDGKSDVVTGYYNSNTRTSNILVAEGSTGETLWSYNVTGDRVFTLAIGDFNDGIPDVASIHYDLTSNAGLLIVLDSNGMTHWVFYQPSEDYIGIVAEDFDQDGTFEVAVASSSGKVYIVRAH